MKIKNSCNIGKYSAMFCNSYFQVVFKYNLHRDNLVLNQTHEKRNCARQTFERKCCINWGRSSLPRFLCSQSSNYWRILGSNPHQMFLLKKKKINPNTKKRSPNQNPQNQHSKTNQKTRKFPQGSKTPACNLAGTY